MASQYHIVKLTTGQWQLVHDVLSEEAYNEDTSRGKTNKLLRLCENIKSQVIGICVR